jgi:hypothetical protein
LYPSAQRESQAEHGTKQKSEYDPNEKRVGRIQPGWQPIPKTEANAYDDPRQAEPRDGLACAGPRERQMLHRIHLSRQQSNGKLADKTKKRSI